MIAATWLAIANNDASLTPVHFFGPGVALMPALVGFVVKLVWCIVFTPLFQVAKRP